METPSQVMLDNDAGWIAEILGAAAVSCESGERSL